MLHINVHLEKEAENETANAVGCTIMRSNVSLRGSLLQPPVKIYSEQNSSPLGKDLVLMIELPP